MKSSKSVDYTVIAMAVVITLAVITINVTREYNSVAVFCKEHGWAVINGEAFVCRKANDEESKLILGDE